MYSSEAMKTTTRMIDAIRTDDTLRLLDVAYLATANHYGRMMMATPQPTAAEFAEAIAKCEATAAILADRMEEIGLYEEATDFRARCARWSDAQS